MQDQASVAAACFGAARAMRSGLARTNLAGASRLSKTVIAYAPKPQELFEHLGQSDLLGHLEPLRVQSWERCAGAPSKHEGQH